MNEVSPNKDYKYFTFYGRDPNGFNAMISIKLDCGGYTKFISSLGNNTIYLNRIDSINLANLILEHCGDK